MTTENSKNEWRTMQVQNVNSQNFKAGYYFPTLAKNQETKLISALGKSGLKIKNLKSNKNDVLVILDKRDEDFMKRIIKWSNLHCKVYPQLNLQNSKNKNAYQLRDSFLSIIPNKDKCLEIISDLKLNVTNAIVKKDHCGVRVITNPANGDKIFISPESNNGSHLIIVQKGLSQSSGDMEKRYEHYNAQHIDSFNGINDIIPFYKQFKKTLIKSY